MPSASLPDVIPLDEIDNSFSSHWVELLKSSTQASFFHQLHYLKALQDAFDRRICLWVEAKGHFFEAAGMLFPSGTSRKILTAPYFLPYQDILIRSYKEELQTNRISRIVKIHTEFMNFIEQKSIHAEFEFSPETGDVREYLYRDKWYVHPRYTFYVRLDHKKDILSSVHRDERRQIRNLAYEYTWIESLNVDEFVELNTETYNRHQISPPLNKKMMKRWLNSIRHLQGVHFLGMKNASDELVAGLIYTTFKQRAYFLLGGARRIKGPSFTPTLYYKLFKNLQERGITEIDLLGGMHREIARFKIHMGGIPVLHFRLEYSGSKMLQSGFKIVKSLRRFLRKRN